MLMLHTRFLKNCSSCVVLEWHSVIVLTHQLTATAALSRQKHQKQNKAPHIKNKEKKHNLERISIAKIASDVLRS